ANGNRGFIPRDYGYTQGLYVASGGTWHVCAPEVMSPYLGGPKLPLVPQSKDPFVLKDPNALTNADSVRDQYLAPVFLRMNMLQCPNFPNTQPPVLLPTGQVLSEQPLDYITNGYILDGASSADGGGLTHLEKIPMPSRLIYITEANQK